MLESQLAYKDPYSSAEQYEKLRPRYTWGNGLAEESLISAKLHDLATEAGKNFSVGIDLGSGAGRYISVLTDVADYLIMTDPSPDMVSTAKKRFKDNVRFDVLLTNAECVGSSGMIQKADLVTAFWSLSYPIQSFFGLVFTSDGNVVQTQTNAVAEKRATSFLESLFPPGRRDYLLVYFSSDSVEQQWVSKIWSLIGPFPGGAREHSWNILKNFLERKKRTATRVDIQRIEGRLVCPDAQSLYRVFLQHHLRGLSPRTMMLDDMKRLLVRDMRPYSGNSGYEIPAAFRLIRVQML